VAVHQEVQKLEAIKPGHLEIERYEIGRICFDDPQRFGSVTRQIDVPNSVDLAEHSSDRAAIERGVVDDQRAKRSHYTLLGGKSV
jgi:hypothetical protein